MFRATSGGAGTSRRSIPSTFTRVRDASYFLDFTKETLTPVIGSTAPTVTRALNTATRVNSSGVIEVVNANLPRFDYDPVTRKCKGLLIEEARTNLCLHSGDASNAAWSTDADAGASAPTITGAYAVAPDGTTTATRVQINRGAGTYSRVQQIIAGASATYTGSIWMRTTSGTGTANVGLRIDATGVNCVVTGTWQRFSVTTSVATTAPALQVLSFTSIVGTDATADIVVWGGQVEAGAFATSYIPTTTASVVRNADVCALTGAGFTQTGINKTTGTALTFATTFNTGATTGVIYASSVAGAFNNSVYSTIATAGTVWRGANYITGGAGVADTIPSYTASYGALVKEAFAWALNDFAQSYNGGTVSTDASGALAVGEYDRLYIGSNWAGSGNFHNGHIRQLAFWTTRLSNTRLQQLTY